MEEIKFKNIIFAESNITFVICNVMQLLLIEDFFKSNFTSVLLSSGKLKQIFYLIVMPVDINLKYLINAPLRNITNWKLERIIHLLKYYF